MRRPLRRLWASARSGWRGSNVDGSSSADSASLWLEARQAMLLGKLRDGAASTTARTALEMATLGGAGCLGRQGELGVLAPGAVADVAVWQLDGPRFAGAIADAVEAWLRCGPVSAWHTIVNGRFVVRAGEIVNPDLPIPPAITYLTGITEAMVAPAPGIESVLPSFFEFLRRASVIDCTS